MYKDKEAQRLSNRLRQQRFKLKNKDIDKKPNIELKNNAQDCAGNAQMVTPMQSNAQVTPSGNALKVTPNSNAFDLSPERISNLTVEQIIAMPAAEAKAILHSWAQGKGNTYQSSLGCLSAQYDIIQTAQQSSTSTGTIQC